MDEFRIITPDRNDLLIVEALPTDLQKHLPGARSWMSKGDFGKMFFHHYAGNNFDIWYSNYYMKRSAKLIGKSDNAILEFHTQYNNSFHAGWNGFSNTKNYYKQYELTYVPDVDTTADFTGGMQYDTFDIHFHKTFLQLYIAFSPQLEKFLTNVENRKATRLLNFVRLLTPEMEENIRAILRYSFHEGLQHKFVEGRVQELMILLVHHLSEANKFTDINPMDLKRAQEARKIICDDFTIYDSVEVIARKLGTTEPRLQIAFKQLYGTTVGKFSREQRLKYAHEILETTNDILLSVSLMVGYPDQANFSTAFKQYFGYSPGHLQKRWKKK